MAQALRKQAAAGLSYCAVSSSLTSIKSHTNARLNLPALLSLQNYYLFVGDATVLLPSMAEQEAALASTGQEWANSTTWLGCIVSDAALMAGDTVAELRRLQTAEECCRACREMEGQCNAWTFCNRTEGCRWGD